MIIERDPKKFKDKLVFIILWHIVFLMLIAYNPMFELSSVQATNIIKFMRSLDFNFTTEVHNIAFYSLMLFSYYLISYFFLKVFFFICELIYFTVYKPLLSK